MHRIWNNFDIEGEVIIKENSACADKGCRQSFKNKPIRKESFRKDGSFLCPIKNIIFIIEKIERGDLI